MNLISETKILKSCGRRSTSQICDKLVKTNEIERRLEVALKMWITNHLPSWHELIELYR